LLEFSEAKGAANLSVQAPVWFKMIVKLKAAERDRPHDPQKPSWCAPTG
jgi:hypothetical protein